MKEATLNAQRTWSIILQESVNTKIKLGFHELLKYAIVPPQARILWDNELTTKEQPN